ncbi:MAG: TonB-dependent receptor [Saprospiraceae bacterium]|nr:TonB-dependent receptor [Saprospiraceae bacterium]
MSALSYHSNTYDVNDYILPNGGIKSYAGTIIDNPRWLAEFAPALNNVERYVGSASIDVTPTDWLSIRYQLGLDQYNDGRKRYMPTGTDVGSQVNGFTINQEIKSKFINSNLLVTLKKNLTPDLEATLLMGHTVFDTKSEDFFVRGEGLVIPQFYDISNATNFFSFYDFSQSRTEGLFANVDLSYKRFLNFSASFRRDVTSTLIKPNNSFYYPSVSLGVILNEAFKLPRFVSFAKIRASYAETGKGTSPYLTGGYFGSAANFPFGTTPGFRRSSVIGSPDLRPERTKGVELGLDFQFFDNRFGFEFTYFDQSTIDQIFSIPVSNATGYSRFVANSGEINNKGVELIVNATPIKTKDFRWNAMINFTQTRGKVVSVAEGIDRVLIYDPGFIVSQAVPGGNVGDLFGFPYRRDSASNQLLIGTDGYPIVDLTSLKKVGNAFPDFIAAMTNTITFKGFSLAGQFEWKSGGDVYDMSMRNSFRNGVLKGTERRHELVVFKGVKADGTQNTTPVEVDGGAFYRSEGRYASAADVLLQDASWLRLRSISLGYTLPADLLRKSPFSTATITFSGNNVWLNTPYRGADPEASQNGSGSNAFGFAGLTIPAVRSYSVALNFSFK